MAKCFEDGVCIHGAFSSKAKAEAKARARGGRVKAVWVGKGKAQRHAYLVMSRKGKR
jgi:hypothetical protein